MTLANKVDQFNSDADIAHEIIHGDASTTVETEGGPVRSLAKLVADTEIDIGNQMIILAGLAAPGGSMTIGHSAIATSVAGTIGWRAQSEAINIKDFPWNAACDADEILGTGTDDTAAIQAAVIWAEDHNKDLYFPGKSLISAEIIRRKTSVWRGAGSGNGNTVMTDWTMISGLVFVGNGVQRVRTRSLYRANSGDPNDAPLSCAVNVQAPFCTFKEMAVYKWFDRTNASPTNYGGLCDVGIFNGCNQGMKMDDVQVFGYWDEAAVYIDVTGSNSLDRFPDADDVPFNNYPRSSGTDGLKITNSIMCGGKWGVRIVGAEPKAGLNWYGYKYLVGATITVAVIPLVGDTITINGVVFTFATSRSETSLSVEIRIGETLAETAFNIADSLEQYALDLIASGSASLFPTAQFDAYSTVVQLAAREGYTLALTYSLATSTASITLSGATVAAQADPAQYYDGESATTIADNRGAVGCSDVGISFSELYGTDHHSRWRRNDITGNPVTDTSGGALFISGMAGNSSRMLQGIRLYSCRIASREAFRIKTVRANRVEVITCHIEPRGTAYSTAGVLLNTGDYTTPVSYGQWYAPETTTNTVVFGLNVTLNKTWFSSGAQFTLTELGQSSSNAAQQIFGSLKVNRITSRYGEFDLRSAAGYGIRFRTGSSTLATLTSTGLGFSTAIANPVISAPSSNELILAAGSGSSLRGRISGTTVMLFSTTESTMYNTLRPNVNGNAFGTVSARWGVMHADSWQMNGSSGPSYGFCTGTPEGAVTARIGSTRSRTDGGAVTSFYVKESGTGNTGWVAK